MNVDHSVTGWIRGLKDGDEQSAARIWDRFFERLCRLASQRLANTPSRESDPEDVALSAIHALCAGAREDRFRKLENRADLWDVLAMITVRKSIDARRRADRPSEARAAFDELAQVEALPSSLPELIDDDYVERLGLVGQELLDQLDPMLQRIALMKLEGHSNAEVADRTGLSLPTVERRLRMIRSIWSASAA